MATNHEYTQAQQSRAYAFHYGFWVGLCWVGSFMLTVAGLSSPMMSNLGLLMGLGSLVLGVSLLRGFRDHIGPLPLGRAWYMSWLTFMAAALLCTAFQYIYFAYLDDGAFVVAYTEMLHRPEMEEAIDNMFPQEDMRKQMDEFISIFSTTPPAQKAISFLMANVLLASIVAFPVALFSKDPMKTDNNGN